MYMLEHLTSSTMMAKSKYIATWSEGTDTREIEIDGYDELLKLLDGIGPKSDQSTMLEVYDRDTRRSLAIGLGKDRTVVTYQDSLDPPYFISLGNAEEEGVEVFVYGGESTEYLKANLVSLARGFGALSEFFQSDTRPEACQWEKL